MTDEDLYFEYKKVQDKFNAMIKNLSPSSQAYKFIQKEKARIYGMSPKNHSYTQYRGGKYFKSNYLSNIDDIRREQMISLISSFNKFSSYKSSTQEGYEDIKNRQQRTYEANDHALSYDDLMDWIQNSDNFAKMLSSYDSDTALKYAQYLIETSDTEDEAKDKFDSMWDDEKSFINKNAEFYKGMTEKEKDEFVAQRISEYLEKMMAKFK